MRQIAQVFRKGSEVRHVAILVFAATIHAQTGTGRMAIHGSVRTRAEGWDWFQADTGDGSYLYSGNIFRVNLTQTRRRMDWQLEFAAPLLFGLPETAVGPGSQGGLGLGANYYAANDQRRNAAMVFVKQGYVRWSGLFADENQSLKVGRFEFNDGSEVTPKNATLAALRRDRISQRLIGNFGWTHVGRSLDGFHYVANHKVAVHLIGALPTRGVFQVDGWGPLETGLVYLSANGGHSSKTHSSDWRLFGIYYHDWRHVLKVDNRSLALRRADTGNLQIGTYGGHYLHAAQAGRSTVDLMVWAALQTGRWGTLAHRAGAVALEGGWQPPVLTRVKPWVRGGYYHGSGDGNPADGRHGTFFQLLPTPRPFARFPFFNLMNNEDIHTSLAWRPHKAVLVKHEAHALRLASGADQWLVGGGAFQPWTFGYAGRATNGAQSLANLYDTSVEYRYKPNVTFTGYYGFAQGLAVTRAIYLKGKNGAFGYVEVNYRF